MINCVVCVSDSAFFGLEPPLAARNLGLPEFCITGIVVGEPSWLERNKIIVDCQWHFPMDVQCSFPM